MLFSFIIEFLMPFLDEKRSPAQTSSVAVEAKLSARSTRKRAQQPEAPSSSAECSGMNLDSNLSASYHVAFVLTQLCFTQHTPHVILYSCSGVSATYVCML